MKKYLLISFACLMILFSSKTGFSQIGYCYDWNVVGYGYSEILYNNQLLQVSGLSGTEIIVYDYTPYFCDHDFNAVVYSELANSSGVLSYGRLESNGWDVEGQHPVFNAQYRSYCVTSAHGFVDYWSYDDGKILRFFTDEYWSDGYSQDCHTFTPPPTPTPTPPCLNCQDIQATIQPFEIIEKYNVVDVPITVSNAVDSSGQPLTTTFSIRTTSETGSATFENGSSSISFQGNIMNQNLRIKGVTESSQVNNIIIEAKYNNRLLDDETFTVAAITALEFDRIDNSYEVLDANPGTDGIVNPDGSEGQRIYPDKISVADVNAPVQIDRSLVKVTATITPAIPNLTVYFASFDLDDPSANSTPIDTNGSIGNDNNGNVISSLSGGFANPATGGTCSGATAGTTPNYISKITCTTSATTITTNFKVTMQPGDNFTVFANLTGAAIPDNFGNSGSSITTASGGNIHISGQPNTAQTLGIRTNMLTVWRKLHIEVDSMGEVTGNSETGQITDTKKVGPGNQTLNLSVSNLELNRFENGRIVITRTDTNGNPATIADRRIVSASSSTANTASSVTILNNSGTFNVQNGDSFKLYDDDNMDNGAGSLNGDTGEDVPMLARTYIQDSDDPNLNHFVPAYITPKYDIGNNNNSVSFVLNTATHNNQGIRAFFEFNQVATEAEQNFWTVYLLSAYQHTTARDEDPESEFQNTIVGIADGSNDINGIFRGQGSVVFFEPNGPKECPSTSTQPPLPPEFCNIDSTKLHEIGHRLGADHNEGGVMDDLTTDFSPTSIAIIRGFDYP